MGIKIPGLLEERPPKTLSSRESSNLSLSEPPSVCCKIFPKIAMRVYVGEGRHKITQPVSTSMIILLWVIVKQKMIDDILNVLV